MTPTTSAAPAVGLPLLAAGFAALPSATLLLTLDWQVVAASDAYLALTGTPRPALLGQSLFAVFGGAAGTPEADTMTQMQASLAHARRTGQPQAMPAQHYRLPDPATGELTDRYWQPLNSPILDAEGTCTGLLHTVVDVTTQRQTEAQLAAAQVLAQAAQAEVERQRQLLHDVLMQLPAQVAVHEGPDQVFTLVNPTYQRIAPGRQLLGQPIRTAWPELVSQGILDVLDGVYRTGEPFVGRELPLQVAVTGTGALTQLYLNAFFLPLRNAQGQLYGVLDFSVDVTEQVEARRQVEQLNHALEARVAARTQEAEAAHAAAEHERGQLHRTLSQVPAYVATFSGPDHVYAYFNEAYQRVLAQGRARLGQSVAALFPELAAQGFIGVLDQVYATGQQAAQAEVPVVLADPVSGHERTLYLNVVYQALRDEQGQTNGLLAFATDVTEQVLARRQAEALQAALLGAAQRRARQRQELYEIFAQAPVAIVLLREPNHQIDYHNAAYTALFPPDEWAGGAAIEGHPLDAVYPRLRQAGLSALLDRVYRTGAGEVVAEMPLAVLQPGSPRYVTFAYQAYREDAAVAGVAAFVYDVTEQVLARQQVQLLNQELTAANARLTRTNADLDTFVYTASHDLKAPITNVEGLLEALRQVLAAETPPPELVTELLRLLDDTVSRFRLTITQLTDLVRLQQTHTGAAEWVPLATLVAQVQADLAAELTAARATVHVAIAPALPVYFAPANVRSIVYNLLSNAVKYRDPARPAQVWVQAAQQPDGVVLTVRDNGLGLSAGQQGRLFQVFQRLHTHVEGTGVGLYMIKRLIENGGGDIIVESEAGTGSTFTVRFPAP